MEQIVSQHLQKIERTKIQTLLDTGNSIDDIAIYLNRHRSTIYREMKRSGVGIENYEAETYHKSARKNMGRKVSKAPSSKTISIIERQILNEQWSPEQISNWLRINNHKTVSHTWIYQYINKDKSEGGELSDNLRIGSYSKVHKLYKGNIVDRVSIEKRATIVNERKRLGDYEIDLIVGPKNKGAILTIIDRMSRYCILGKLTGKTSLEVSDKIIKLLNPSSNSAFTVTTDNGTEFTDHKRIAEKLNIKYYFAHPYASYERGSIENLNGLVREYIPKGTDFANVSQNEVKIIEGKLNRRPRKVLEFLSPAQYARIVRKSHLKL